MSEWTDRYRAWEKWSHDKRDDEKATRKQRNGCGGCSRLDRSAEREFFERPEEEKLWSCRVLCGRGRALLREGQFGRASRHFRKSLTHAEYAVPENPTELNICRVSSLEGLAECQFHLKRYLQVVEACSQALRIDPGSSALLRRAMAFRLLDRYDEAERDLDSLTLTDNKQEEALGVEREKLRARKEAYQRLSKDQSRRMFLALGPEKEDDVLDNDDERVILKRREHRDLLDDLYEPLSPCSLVTSST